MTSDDLAALRDSYAKMQAIRADDNRSWMSLAGIHGFPGAHCWHHNRVFNGNKIYPYNLFLPWHRAYLLEWENYMIDQNPDATLPWWDWTAGTIPHAFTVAKVGAAANSLAHGPGPTIPNSRPGGPTKRFPGQNAGQPVAALPNKAAVDRALDQSTFNDFTVQVEDLHDAVHGWTGGYNGQDVGDMSQVASAAYDPIFWSHHAMIDRLWFMWQQRWGVNTIPTEYLDLPLAPFSMRVRDVLDIRLLGYQYAIGAKKITAKVHHPHP